MDNCPKKDCHVPNALIFKKVVIPASVADDRVTPPKNGEYCNAIVEYEATENAYIYSSDGIPTQVSSDSIALKEAIKQETKERKEEDKHLAEALDEESTTRYNADQDIWREIETIEAASDVVDVVGTYAELQQYDTSKLKDNDIIKVLADETRDDAITYYRWSTATNTFTYVGAEGPYYTASETDTLLAGKQDKLIAGTNIQIAADGKTISATDTTYTHFTGATASADGTQGLVPGPVAGDENKVLKGDGTWQNLPSISDGVILWVERLTGPDGLLSPGGGHIWSSSNTTEAPLTYSELVGIFDVDTNGSVDVYIYEIDSADRVMRVVSFSDDSGYFSMVSSSFNGEIAFYDVSPATSAYDPNETYFKATKTKVQPELTAGTNIQINGNVISATDTTYSAFTGATSQAAGTAGLVPAPAIGDDTKYLKGDGTWATVSSGSNNVAVFYTYVTVGQSAHLYSDQSMTTMITTDDFRAAIDDPNTIVVIYDPDGDYQHIVLSGEGTTAYILDERGSSIYEIYGNSVAPDNTTFAIVATEYQPKLTAGSNISIGTVSGVPNTISVTGMPVLYGSQGQNTDGAVTQKFFTDTVGNVETILQTLNSGAGVP